MSISLHNSYTKNTRVNPSPPSLALIIALRKHEEPQENLEN